jgi:nucleosome assembly protein 1-like 1
MTAPTPQNTPLSNAPITREALSRPTVGTIGEEAEDGAGMFCI